MYVKVCEIECVYMREIVCGREKTMCETGIVLEGVRESVCEKGCVK